MLSHPWGSAQPCAKELAPLESFLICRASLSKGHLNRLDSFLFIRDKQLPAIDQVINKRLWSIYWALSVLPPAVGNVTVNDQELLNYLPSRPILCRQGLPLISTESPKSDNIQDHILPSQKHLTHQEGIQRLARHGALALGLLELGSLPILLVCVLDPCWTALLLVFLSLLLASPGFLPVHVSPPVSSKSDSQRRCLLDSTPVDSRICPCFGLTLVTPSFALGSRVCRFFSSQPDAEP